MGEKSIGVDVRSLVSSPGSREPLGDGGGEGELSGFSGLD